MKKTALTLLGSLLAAGAMAFAPMSAQAVELTPEQRAEVDNFVLGASTAIMLHEMGHLLVNELEIPILGREEDVADTIAALILLIQDEEDEERATAYLNASVVNWFLFGRNEPDEISDARMADEHSLSRQRAFATICLAYGSGHPRFRSYAQTHSLPEDRMASCELEFPATLSSFIRLMTPHFLEDDAEQGAQAIVVYEESENYPELVERLQAEGFLEELADVVFSEIAMPRDVIFAAGECQMINAFYSPSFDEGIPAVVFCYEMGDYIAGIYADAFFGEGADDETLPIRELAEAVENDGEWLSTDPQIGLDDEEDFCELFTRTCNRSILDALTTRGWMITTKTRYAHPPTPFAEVTNR